MKKELVLLTFIQIFLMLSLPASTSLNIQAASENSFSNILEIPEIFGKSLEQGISLLVGFLSIKEIGVVSASEWTCCPETKTGALCQDIPKKNSEDCAVEVLKGKCEKTEICELGCCIDEEEGLCSTNSARGSCEENGGKWESGASCLISECKKGCCVLGSSTKFTTEKECQTLSEFYGFDTKLDLFNQIQTEIECIILEQEQKIGACVLEGEKCKLNTKLECHEMSGIWYEEKLCSNPNLNTACEKQTSVGCVDGRDEIYWFDSCGNRENIYSSDKDFSWNNGLILKKYESCNSDSSNANSLDCGNCNYFLGSACSEGNGILDGNFVCENLNCIDEEGKERLNGESWCSYDSAIGVENSPFGTGTLTTDAPGSRHWKQMCVDGEILVEACGDYRGQICAESEIKIENSKEKFSQASCVINDAISCINYNNKADMETKCSTNKACEIKQIDIDEGFRFNMCVAKYPKGFDLTNSKNKQTASALCGLATRECLVIYTKTVSGWDCIMNCECEEEKFAQQMNDLCVSLGDCGSYPNYKGKGTDNILVSESPTIGWESYAEFSQPIANKYATPIVKKQWLAAFSNADALSIEMNPSNIGKIVGMVGTVSGTGGSILQALTLGLGSYEVGLDSFQAFLLDEGVISNILSSGETSVANLPLNMGPLLQGFGSALTGASTGLLVAQVMIKLFGLENQAAEIASLAGAITGVVGGAVGYAAGAAYSAQVTAAINIGMSASAAAGSTSVAAAGSAAAGSSSGGLGAGAVGASMGPGMAAFLTAFVWAIIIVAILSAIMKAVGIGDTKEIKVQFDCYPWQAPSGGSDCSKCGQDPLKPCSKYQCESLGQACKFVNENTENPSCVKIGKDTGKPPEISINNVQEGYQIKKIEDKTYELRTNENECISEFQKVSFELQTDSYAQCKLDYERKASYDKMSNYFLEGNYYEINHTYGLLIPSLKSLESYGVMEEVREKLEEANIFIRCKDKYGNVNSKEVAINFCVNKGPDLTPASIVSALPFSGTILPEATSETNLKIYLNEPAECKYSLEPNTSYFEMPNSFECKTNLTDLEFVGWPCTTKLEELREQNEVYIKCKDSPWEVQDSLRNVNSQDFIYNLKVSQTPLEIISVSPNSEIKTGEEPISVNLQLETAGGISEGVASCYYSFLEGEEYILMKDTLSSSSHSQDLDFLMSGKTKIYFLCEDTIGNIATAETEFEINLDDSAPAITRIYREGSNLKLVTDEDAKCYFRLDDCGFKLEFGEPISLGYSKTHVTEWKEGKTYYIRCEDIWGNRKNYCDAEITPNSLE